MPSIITPTAYCRGRICLEYRKREREDDTKQKKRAKNPVLTLAGFFICEGCRLLQVISDIWDEGATEATLASPFH